MTTPDAGTSQSSHTERVVDHNNLLYSATEAPPEPQQDKPDLLIQRINRDAVLRAISDPGRISSYTEVIKAVASLLSPSEYELLIQDPIRFTSADFLFRGVSLDAFQRAKETGFYQPQAGQHCGHAVYTSNSPFTSFEYSRSKDGMLVVFDKSKIDLMTPHGIVDVASDLYRTENEEYLKGIPKTRHRDEVFTMDNRWDISVSSGTSNPEARNIELRKPQPFSATVAQVFVPKTV